MRIVGDFLEECKRKYKEGRTDFVPGLIVYASMLETQRELEKRKKDSNVRKLNVFSGNY